MKEPKTLQAAIVHFSNPDNCVDYLVSRRWPDGVVCPGCGSAKVSYNAKRHTWKCGSHHPRREFSVKVGTIFEDSPIGLDKWLLVTWMVTNCKNGVSSYEVARDIGVSQKTAWFMLHRIRLAMKGKRFKMGGPGREVETDEAFIGGKDSNKHEHQRQQIRSIRRSANLRGSGHLVSKTAVMGVLDREERKVQASVVPALTRLELQTEVLNRLMPGSKIYTDSAGLYKHIPKKFTHQFVDHVKRYVDGRVHTNGMENFWSCLKRGLGGTYVAVEPFHLFRYLDEQVFRYNNRSTPKKPMTDADRFSLAISQVVGKRLTFAELTGKVGAAEAF